MEQIVRRLFEMQDLKYRDFNAKLIPNIEKERVIGVRTPQLRGYAKELLASGEWEPFLKELPHRYQEENALHGYILGGLKEARGEAQKDVQGEAQEEAQEETQEKAKAQGEARENIQKEARGRRGAGVRLPFGQILEEIERFLPFVENWAVCDTICPKVFKNHPEEVYERIQRWVKSEHEYTVRFGLVTLLQFFLDEEFRPEMLELAAGVRREEYYINMALAWYLSFALIKQYETALPLLESRRLDPWVQNKTIQKAVESYRISEERKAYLRTLKVTKK